MSALVPAQALHFSGPAGTLEGLIESPMDGPLLLGAVICHPHPLYGGSLHNKVVHTLARALGAGGAGTLRFNFRGVGASSGQFDGGLGETDDTLAAAALVRERWPNAPLVLAGFSFGGAVALRAAAQVRPDWLILVAPAIERVPLDKLSPPTYPWLVVQGEADEVVSADSVRQWLAGLTPRAPPQLCLLAGVGHFFHGQLHTLRDCLATHWPRSLPHRRSSPET